MAINKMNVLHWHLSDDETFTLELKNHPEITQKGIFKQD